MPLVTVVLLAIAYFAFTGAGTEIFPRVDSGQLQVRLRMPPGTRIDRTEDATKKTLELIARTAGSENVAITSAFVGLQPPTYAINPIYLYTSGPQEAVIKVNLVKGSRVNMEDLKETLRSLVPKQIPGAVLSFEPADLVDQVMSLGTSNPVEVMIQGKNLPESRMLAEKLIPALRAIPYLRDMQIAQPLDYPTIQINYDRVRAGQMGISVSQAGKSVLAGTSSSRFTEPVYWLDNVSGNAYQVQVEYPQLAMNSPEQIEQIPVGKSGGQTMFLRDIADWKQVTSIGEYDRINQLRFITVTANLYKKDLGRSISDIQEAIAKLGVLPPGVKCYLRGQSEVLKDTTLELATGLLLAVVVIGLLLTAWFQSVKLSLTVLFVVPGVLAGSMLLLWLTGNTMNIQSFMGCIMAVAVAVSNAVLLISNAEDLRSDTGREITGSGMQAAENRLRPILMTSLAMIAGMIPMSLGFGEGSKQTAALGIAVIGGLLFSTMTTLCLIPVLYDWITSHRKVVSASYDPTDKRSTYFDQTN